MKKSLKGSAAKLPPRYSACTALTTKSTSGFEATFSQGGEEMSKGGMAKMSPAIVRYLTNYSQAD